MTITLVDHDPNWHNFFKSEYEKLMCQLGGMNPEIHHIGSTAIPTIKAKPVIDIMILVPNIDDEEIIKNQLSMSGYHFIRHIGTRLFFGKGLNAKTMCNLHVFAQNDPDARKNVVFRDYLRQHTDLRAEYEQLKIKLVLEYSDDIEKYSNGKTQFILRVLSLATKQT